MSDSTAGTINLGPSIAAAAKASVSRQDANMTHAQVEQVTKDVGDVVINQTNQEPWWQSSVTLGAILTLVGGVYNFVWQVSLNGAPDPQTFIALMTPLAGAAWTLYGRWIQRKPFGVF